MSVYDEAIVKYPNLPMLHVLKGELISNFNNSRLTNDEENYQRALREFNLALEIDPNFVQAYSRRAILNLTNQKYKLAIADFDAVLKLTKGDNEQQFYALMDRGNARLTEFKFFRLQFILMLQHFS